MKKQLLMVLAIAASMSISAENKSTKLRAKVPANAKPIPVRSQLRDPYQLPLNTNASLNYVSANRTAMTGTEATIGQTIYDLQSNSAIMNRIINHPNGTISATWTMIAPNGVPADRGTGYNYFDGTSWGPMPTARIEPTNRTGFVNIATSASGREMSIAHSSTAPGMLITSRPTVGTGAWTEDATVLGAVSEDTWAKAIAGGTNGESVHAIWNANNAGLNSQYSSLLYSRSLDGGVTWPILRTVLPDLDATHYRGFGGDAYSIDSNGDTIAFVVGDFDTDLILLKSTDNGTSWVSTVVSAFPFPLYNDSTDFFPDLDGDGVSDDQLGNSGDAHVMLDHNGKAHVFWSQVLMRDTSATDLLGYFPNTLDVGLVGEQFGGILYWNESYGANPPDTIARAEDMDGDGEVTAASGALGTGAMGFYRGDVTGMPTSGIDAAGNLFLAYQSLCETCDTSVFQTSHKHVYVKASTDSGATWNATGIDIDYSTDMLNEECAFACMAKHVDNDIHVVYQRDPAPGHSLLSGSPENDAQAALNTSTPSDIVYSKVPKTDVILGTQNVKTTAPASSLTQNSPNPSNGVTSIGFKIAAESKVTFEVTDVLGNVVYTENKGVLNSGNYKIALNTETLSSGAYFYSLKVNNQKETKKMMVN